MYPEGQKQVLSLPVRRSLLNIVRSHSETLAKDLRVILGLFRAHQDEKYVYEILIKPSLSKVPQGMQFGK